MHAHASKGREGLKRTKKIQSETASAVLNLFRIEMSLVQLKAPLRKYKLLVFTPFWSTEK